MRICWLRTKRLNILDFIDCFFNFFLRVFQILYRSSEYKNAKERSQPELISVKQPIVSMNRLKIPLGIEIARKRMIFVMKYGTFTMLVAVVSVK